MLTGKSSLQMINEWRSKTDENAKSQCAHIKALDRHVYLMNKKILKDCKFLSCTHIDYLTDFDAMNIYHIWISHLKQVFCVRNIQIDKTITFDSNNSHFDSFMIIEIKIFIHIIKISDLSDIAQTDFNYWYEDWNDILISDLKFLLLEFSQKHTITMISSDFREYDQFFTSETTFSTSDSTLRVLICILKLIVEFTTEFQITESQITHSLSSDFIGEQSIFADSQSNHANLSDHLINMSK